MRLSELFRSANPSRTDENGEGVLISQKNLNNANLNRQIRALAPGQTLYGEVISKNGSEVQIKVADDMVLSARLERELAIDIGKIMTFEVRNNGKTLTLSPLFANTATDANVLKALDMASIPVSESSVEMTQTMMEQGMSVDKNSIQSVYRDVTANMDAAVRDIVQLHQLGIDVTPETLEQLKNYQSMQHQITGAMDQIVKELGGYVEDLLQSENPKQGIILFTKLQEIFSENGLQQPVTDVKQEQNLSESPNLTQVVNGENSSGNSLGTSVEDIGNSLLVKETLKPEEMQVLKENFMNLDREGANVKIQNLLKGLDGGTATIAEVKEVLGAKEVEILLKEKLKANWLLEPEQFQSKDEVEKTYQRINRQLFELQKVFGETPGMEHGFAAKSVTNMQSNLDFMNQLNQTFTYIQLPLQMSGKETHGELYVYTNKRNLAREDGSVSAFLHLDMENLGPVDVYVAMQNQKVNTKFYLRDDEMIDFIQTHIHILNERLEGRGYSMNCEMLVKEQEEEEKSILERIIESEKNVSVLSQYSFDVRA